MIFPARNFHFVDNFPLSGLISGAHIYNLFPILTSNAPPFSFWGASPDTEHEVAMNRDPGAIDGLALRAPRCVRQGAFGRALIIVIQCIDDTDYLQMIYR